MIRKRTEGIVFHRAEVWNGDDYHCIVMRDGAVKYLNDFSMLVWHACRYNQSTIAIATFGDFASSEPGLNWHPTEAQIQTVTELAIKLNKQYGDRLWGAGHSELGHLGTQIPRKLVVGHTCPGEHFPLERVLLGAKLKPFTLSKSATNLIV